MKKNLTMFALALLVLTLVVAVILTLIAVPATPVPWVLLVILALVPYIHRKVVARRYLQWDERYDTGIEAIDHDHRRLLNLVNQFQTASDYSTGPGFEHEALEALQEYINHHFAREEKLMEEYGYPEYEEHKRQHREMTAKVDALMARFRESPDRTLAELQQFLKRWLIDHIGGTDQRYVAFFREKGVR